MRGLDNEGLNDGNKNAECLLAPLLVVVNSQECGEENRTKVQTFRLKTTRCCVIEVFVAT